MGNIGSQTGHINHRNHTTLDLDGRHHHQHHHPHHSHHQWTHSYGKDQQQKVPQQQQLKVLPERDVHQKLRSTGNGEILQAGGTLSGRQQWQGVTRSSSIPPGDRDRNSVSPPPAVRSRPTTNSRYAPRSSHHKDQMKRSGSEPDLRGPVVEDDFKSNKGRKKYKAPAPPPNNTNSDKPSTDEDHCSAEADSPARKTRLFKTHAETKKKCSSPQSNRRFVNNIPEAPPLISTRHKSTDNLSQLPLAVERAPYKSNKAPKHTNMPVMQRTRSSPDFQTELREATKRLGDAKRRQTPQPHQVEGLPPQKKSESSSKLKTLDHNLHKKEAIRNKIKELKAKEMALILDVRTPASGKDSTPEQSPPKVKTFYFGMEQEHEDLATSLGSDISSESDTEISAHGIALQLRPILPKKQLEIPSFSPAAAWRLLSAVDLDPRAASTAVSEDGPVFYEDRIENTSRPPPPHPLQQGPRSNNDKSGDSGISGDETPDAVLMSPRYRGNSWTPQQDLGDDSSLEEGLVDANIVSPSKFTSKPHVFSLSLPRENHLSTYIAERTSLQPFTSLQKLKKSVSGVLGHISNSTNKKDVIAELDLIDPSDNWFLSRSAPNSLNNGFSSLELRRSKVDDSELVTSNMVRVTQNSRRIMYLPQSQNNSPDTKQSRRYMSKSHENLSTDLGSHPQNLQDPPKAEEKKWMERKPKKFTFQSTVRQIERRRLAEKLSKEVERKEKQRLRELEAMQRVEEEFQKKRAREKATIRQQLRLYSMDDTSWSSLPPNIDLSEEVREEPDGAVSSTTASPTLAKMSEEAGEIEFRNKAAATQVLSEYRQPQREYRDYRTSGGNGRHFNEQATTVHPKVTCNMPKVTGSGYTDNYRKDFAHGVKTAENGGRSEEPVVSAITRNQSPMIRRSCN